MPYNPIAHPIGHRTTSHITAIKHRITTRSTVDSGVMTGPRLASKGMLSDRISAATSNVVSANGLRYFIGIIDARRNSSVWRHLDPCLTSLLNTLTPANSPRFPRLPPLWTDSSDSCAIDRKHLLHTDHMEG
jgi:hypothetical protein